MDYLLMTDIKQLLQQDNLLTLLGYSQYEPAKENMRRLAKDFASESQVDVLGCQIDGHIAGLIALRKSGHSAAEILAIAVAPNQLNRGIGRYMIQYVIDTYHLTQLVAETDDDAVGFYHKCGFSVTRLNKQLYGCTRYRCVLSAISG